ncbi:MAG: hypothetical protein LBJ18_01315 [Rickettsiales bacterium]|jgi:hypothetical protein|nr:hypothetical protein [Rickettsiales bacterium]
MPKTKKVYPKTGVEKSLGRIGDGTDWLADALVRVLANWDTIKSDKKAWGKTWRAGVKGAAISGASALWLLERMAVYLALNNHFLRWTNRKLKEKHSKGAKPPKNFIQKSGKWLNQEVLPTVESYLIWYFIMAAMVFGYKKNVFGVKDFTKEKIELLTDSIKDLFSGDKKDSAGNVPVANGTQGQQATTRSERNDLHTGIDKTVEPDRPEFARCSATLIRALAIHDDQWNTSAEYKTSDGFILRIQYFKPGTVFPKNIKPGDLIGYTMSEEEWRVHHTSGNQQHLHYEIRKGKWADNDIYDAVPMAGVYGVSEQARDLAGKLLNYRKQLMDARVKKSDSRWKDLIAAAGNMKKQKYDKVEEFCAKYNLDQSWKSAGPKIQFVDAAWISRAPSPKDLNIKQAEIDPTADKETYLAQMRSLEPALAVIAVSKEGVWELGFKDPDDGHITGSTGLQNKNELGKIEFGEKVPGYDGKFGLSESEKKRAYDDVVWYYRNNVYDLMRSKIKRKLTATQAIVLADMFYQHGDWTANKNGSATGLLNLINNPKSTDAQIVAEMSKWRYVSGSAAGGSILRRGFLSALWMGDINLRDLILIESGALYNSSSILDSYIFWKGSKSKVIKTGKGNPLTYEFDAAAWEQVLNYTYPDKAGAFKNGQGKNKAKGGNLAPVKNMLPESVIKELEKTLNGLPKDNTLAWTESKSQLLKRLAKEQAGSDTLDLTELFAHNERA